MYLDKYGIIPESLFPDTHASANSENTVKLLNYKLREYSLSLRDAVKASPKPTTDGTEGSGGDDGIIRARQLKLTYMKEVYNMLCIVFGEPPRADEKVKWEYNDKEGKAHVWEGTPRDCYREMICKRGENGGDFQGGAKGKINLADRINMISDPRRGWETVHAVARCRNVWGAKQTKCE